MEKIDDYEVVLTAVDSKAKNYFNERSTDYANWVIFQPGAPLEVSNYSFVYHGSDYDEFKAYIKNAIKSKDVHTLTFDDGTTIPVIIISAVFKQNAGEVDTLRGGIKVILLDGYDYTVDATYEVIENIWGVQ